MSFGVARTTGKGEYRAQPGVWKAAIAVVPGDIMYRASDGYDKPVSSFAWDTDLGTTLAAVHDLIRGVSGVRRTTTQTADGGREQGVIYANGEFELPCAALGSAAKPGDLVTIAKASGNALLAQQIVVTSTISHAIGRVTEDAAIGATTLKFELEPALFMGGAQAIA